MADFIEHRLEHGMQKGLPLHRTKYCGNYPGKFSDGYYAHI